MKKIFILLFFIINCELLTVNCLEAKDYYPYFYDAQGMNGGSGKISNPSTRTVAYQNWAVGLHCFQLSLSCGLFPQGESGIFFDLKELSEKKFALNEISFHIKYQFLNWEEKNQSFAFGWQKDQFYLVSEKFFPSFYRWGVLLGLSIQGGSNIAPFFTLYQTPRMSMFLFDYNGKENKYNLGWRFLLSPKVKFDLFLVDLGKIKDINNFIFGVTLSS